MSNIYKKIIILLTVVFLMATCLFVVTASASDINWLAVKYEDKQTQAFLGEDVNLPNTTPIYPQKVKSYYFVVQGPDGVSNVVDREVFNADKVGEYKVFLCVVGNDGSTYSESYTVIVEKSSAPILVEKAVFPVAYLEGSTYSVPKVKFVDYNTQSPTQVDYKVYSVDENGIETEIGEKFSPSVSVHGQSIALKYVAKSSVTNQSNTVIYDNLTVLKPFVENEYGERVYEYGKMFTTKNVESIVDAEKGVKFYGTEEFEISYANNLHADFNIAMISEDGLMNFDKIKITLTDSINENQYITLDYTFIDVKNTKVLVNGTDEFLAVGSLKDYTKGFSLSFSQSTLKLFDSESKLVTTISKTAEGSTFKGFDSQLVKLKVEVKGLNGRSMLEINEINGHGMNRENDGIDATLPYVFPEKDFVYKNGIGDTVLLSKALAVDVVDPCLSSKVTVYDPDGNIVKDNNGNDLFEVDASIDYEFVAEITGVYTIQYTAEDVSYNSYDYGYYSVYVLDVVAPTILVKGDVPIEVSLGSEITLPQVKATDDITASENIFVFVTVNGGVKGIQYLKPKDKVVFDAKGQYFVRFTAVDQNYNFSTVEYSVVCK